jgi:hypothetical protein
LRWAGYVAQKGKKRNSYRILVRKPEGKKSLGRSRCRGVVNVKIDLKRYRMGWYALDQSGARFGPVEGSCEHGNKPSGSIKCWEVFECLHIGSFSRRAQLRK